ncbi:hypothetical protein J0X15_16365 [Roseibium sp. CAU 1637]|uniref:Capsular polysaccharide transport system permease protein n=1 Tax=Roseibium limicola TaxID=2816037 RepID=A0A939ERK0_9HYPH|nr:hypothetical protein [Roseibium limicola]MBO0346802.1 hypothetical protein [Roseibium limicola]
MSLEANQTATEVEVSQQDTPNSGALLDDDLELHRWYDRYLTKWNSFLLTVIIPSLICAFYYAFIASSQYVAETRMIVRTIGVSEQFSTSEDREGRSIIGGDSLTQDSYIVANFLESPEIVRTLSDRIGLRELFSKDSIDFISRLSPDASFETLHKFWNNQIDTYVDGPSGIIIVTIRAFTPEESVEIMNAALAAADEMIERISEKAKQDLVARAETDVRASLSEYQTALMELRVYQNKTGVLDPVSTGKLAISVISTLLEEKLSLTVELNAMKAANAGDSAKARQLERAVEALESEIQLRRDSLAGQSSTGVQLSDQLTEFSRLETRRVVTEAIYEANVRNLDTAKSTALRRTTFVSVFSQAQRPEKSKYPARFSAWIIFTLGMFTLWVTATLVWMSIADHRA